MAAAAAASTAAAMTGPSEKTNSYEPPRSIAIRFRHGGRLSSSGPDIQESRLQPKELRSRRLAVGWTSAQLAAAVGVTPEDVRAWEAAERPIESPRLLDRVLSRAAQKLKTSHR